MLAQAIRADIWWGKNMKFAIRSIVSIFLFAPLALGQESPKPTIPAKPGKMITFEVLIADLAEPLDSPTVEKILELEKARKFDSLTRLQVTSLEEQTASVQFGELAPRATGRSAVARGFRGGPFGGQPVPSYSSVNVGTNVQLVARMDDDGSIVVRLSAERSGLSDQAVDPNDGGPPQSVERLKTETTLRLKPGEPQLVGGQQTATGKDGNKTWIVLIAHIGGKPTSAAK
jgi:Bacterial type II and III secretion system protein